MSHDGLPPLREVIREHGLQPRKSLGQNFLFDFNLTDKIATCGGSLVGMNVVEIGPGPGGLTRSLLGNGAESVTVIERDPRCIPALHEIAEVWPAKLNIIAGDALKFGYGNSLSGPTRIIANLPYNIATPLLVGWLKTEPWPPWFDKMILMFQLEVAERIVATPSDEAFGRLGVLTGWRCNSRILFKVPPEAFTPSPKVTSAVVELVPKDNPEPCEVDALETVTRTAFGQRRKMLRSSLKALWKHPVAELEALGISPDTRPETLPISGFVALANRLAG